MLFTSWLYGTQNDKYKPQLPKGMSQQDLIRIQRFYDMGTEMPAVDWSRAFRYLPVKDIIRNVDGQEGVYEQMILRKPNDPAWFNGGLWHETMPINVPGYWFVSWYDVSSGPNIELFNHVRNSAKDRSVACLLYSSPSPRD